MSESVLLVLPLPPACLSPNRPPASRGGRIAKAKAAKSYRNLAARAAGDQGVEGPWELASVEATFFHAQRRRRDDVNHLAMLKPAYDGLVDAGLLADDDSEHLTTLPCSFEVDRAAPRVELLLRRLA